MLPWYFAGTAPFWLGALYFASDMALDPFADRLLAAESLGMALLFVWCATARAVAMGRLRSAMGLAAPGVAGLSQDPDAGGVLGRDGFVTRVAVHAAFQAALLPLWAACCVFPPAAPLVAGFSATVAAVAFSGEPGARRLLRRAREVGRVSGRPVTSLLMAIVFMMAFVAANIGIVLIGAPHAFKMLTGIDSVFTRAGTAAFNTTSAAVTGALTALVMGPFVATVFALRAFEAEGRATGSDLLAELAEVSGGGIVGDDGGRTAAGTRNGRGLAALAVMAAALSALPPAGVASAVPVTAEAAHASRARAISPGDIDRAAAAVLARREFAWRAPRASDVERLEALRKMRAEATWLDRAAGAIGEVASTVGGWLRDGFGWCGKQLSKLWPTRNIFPKLPTLPSGLPASATLIDWLALARFVALAMIAVGVGFGVVVLTRTWRARWAADMAMAAPPGSAPPMPDLAAQDVDADALPQDDWLALARRLAAEGQPRLSIRALYLAGLSMLAEHGMVTLARAKSNIEYEREATRRLRGSATAAGDFRWSVSAFERSWFGEHPATAETLGEFESRLTRIRATLAGPASNNPPGVGGRVR